MSGDGSADAVHPTLRSRIGFWAGLAAFMIVVLLPPSDSLPVPALRTAAVALLMAVWWMTEALPLPATSLLPLVLFPALGIASPADAAAPYANPVIFLFMGGFILALSMERWGLHRRIALAVVAAVGTSPRRLVLGFMVATAFISMWISNTATAAMMLPIGIALVELLRPAGAAPEAPFPFGTALMLGIAYAATIGGVGTLIGTPPNVILAASARQLLGREISFAGWMVLGVPVVLVMLPIAWAVLVYGLYRPGALPAGAERVLAEERRALGAMHPGERITLVVFCAAALAWVIREPKELGSLHVPGIASVLPGIDDATVAMTAAVVLFMLPAGRGSGERVMNWAWARRLPWGVLLLFGGGLSLAAAFESSGLSRAIGGVVAVFGSLPLWLLLGALAAVFIYLTELTSNTAVAAMAMPVVAAAAAGFGRDPLTFMAAAAVASSLAFMLPVGTPPNAIAFGSGQITIGQMVRAGLWLNVIALVVETVLVYFLVGRVVS